MRTQGSLTAVTVAVLLAGTGGLTPAAAHYDGAAAEAAPRAALGASVQSGGNVRYYKGPDYVYRAVKFSNGGTKAQAVWTGDGPGACFVGTRSGSGAFSGTERTLGGPAKRATYSWSALTAGPRINPPSWLRTTAKNIWRNSSCR